MSEGVGEHGDALARVQAELAKEKANGRAREMKLREFQQTVNENARRNALVINTLQNSELFLSQKVERQEKRIAALTRSNRSLAKKAGRRPESPEDPAETNSSSAGGTVAVEAASANEQLRARREKEAEDRERELEDLRATVSRLETQCEVLHVSNGELAARSMGQEGAEAEKDAKIARLQKEMADQNQRRSAIISQLQANEAMLLHSLEAAKLAAKMADEQLVVERRQHEATKAKLEEEEKARVRLEGEVVSIRVSLANSVSQEGEMERREENVREGERKLAAVAAAATATASEGRQKESLELEVRRLQSVISSLIGEKEAVLARLKEAEVALEATVTQAKVREDHSEALVKELEEQLQDLQEEAGLSRERVREISASLVDANEKCHGLERELAAVRKAQGEEGSEVQAELKSLRGQAVVLQDRLRRRSEELAAVTAEAAELRQMAQSVSLPAPQQGAGAAEEVDDSEGREVAQKNVLGDDEMDLGDKPLTPRDSSTHTGHAQDSVPPSTPVTASAPLQDEQAPRMLKVPAHVVERIAQDARQQVATDHAEQLQSLTSEFARQREAMQKSVANLKEEISQARVREENLVAALDKTTKEHARVSKSLQANNVQLASQIGEYRHRLTRLTEQAAGLRALEQRMLATTNELQKTQARVRELQALLQARDEAAKETHDRHSAEARALAATAATVQEQLKKTQATLETREVDLAAASLQADTLVSQLAAAEARVTEVAEELTAARNAYRDEQEARARDVDGLKVNLRDLQAQCDNLEEARTRLAAGAEEEAARTREIIERLEEVNKQKAEELERQVTANAALQAKIEAQASDVAAMRTAGRQQFETLTSAKAELAELKESAAKDAEALATLRTQLQDQIAAAALQESRGASAVSAWNAERRELEQAIATMRFEAVELEGSLSATKAQLAQTNRLLEDARDREIAADVLRQHQAQQLQTVAAQETELKDRSRQMAAKVRDMEEDSRLAAAAGEKAIATLKAELARAVAGEESVDRKRKDLAVQLEALRQQQQSLLSTVASLKAELVTAKASLAGVRAATPAEDVVSQSQQELQRLEATKREVAAAQEDLMQRERRQKEEVQELNLLMAENERRNHAMITRLQNRETMLVMENERLLSLAGDRAEESLPAPVSVPIATEKETEVIDELRASVKALESDRTQLAQALAENEERLVQVRSDSAARLRSVTAASLDDVLKDQVDALTADLQRVAAEYSAFREIHASCQVGAPSSTVPPTVVKAEEESLASRLQSAEDDNSKLVALVRNMQVQEEDLKRANGLLKEADQMREQVANTYAEELEAVKLTNAQLRVALSDAQAQVASSKAAALQPHPQPLSPASASKTADAEQRSLAAQEATKSLARRVRDLEERNASLVNQLSDIQQSAEAKIRLYTSERQALEQRLLAMQEDATGQTLRAEAAEQHLTRIESSLTDRVDRAEAAAGQKENELLLARAELTSSLASLQRAQEQLAILKSRETARERELEGLHASLMQKELELVKEQTSSREATIGLALCHEELAACQTALTATRDAGASIVPLRQAVDSEALVMANNSLGEELARARSEISRLAAASNATGESLKKRMEREVMDARQRELQATGRIEQLQHLVKVEQETSLRLREQVDALQGSVTDLQERNQSLLSALETNSASFTQQVESERNLRIQLEGALAAFDEEAVTLRHRVADLQAKLLARPVEALSSAPAMHTSVSPRKAEDEQLVQEMKKMEERERVREREERERMAEAVSRISSLEAALESESTLLAQAQAQGNRMATRASEVAEQHREVQAQLREAVAQRDEYADAVVVAMMELEKEQTSISAISVTQSSLLQEASDQLAAVVHQRDEMAYRAETVTTQDKRLQEELARQKHMAEVLQELVSNLSEQVEAYERASGEREVRDGSSRASLEQELRTTGSALAAAREEVQMYQSSARQYREQCSVLAAKVEERSAEYSRLSQQLSAAHSALQAERKKQQQTTTGSSPLEMAQLHINGLESQLRSAAAQNQQLEAQVEQLVLAMQAKPELEQERLMEMAEKIRSLSSAAEMAKEEATRAELRAKEADERADDEKVAAAGWKKELTAEQEAHEDTRQLMENALIALALADPDPSPPTPSLPPASTQARELPLPSPVNIDTQWQVQDLQRSLEEYQQLVVLQEDELQAMRAQASQSLASPPIASAANAPLSRERELGVAEDGLRARVAFLETQLSHAKEREASTLDRLRQVQAARDQDIAWKAEGSSDLRHAQAECKVLRQLLEEAKKAIEEQHGREQSRTLDEMQELRRAHDRELDLVQKTSQSLDREREAHSVTRLALLAAEQEAEERKNRMERLRQELDAQRKAVAATTASHTQLVRSLQEQLSAKDANSHETAKELQERTAELAAVTQELSLKEKTMAAFQDAVREETRAHQKIIIDLEGEVKAGKRRAKGLTERMEQFEGITVQLTDLSAAYQANIDDLAQQQEALELRCSEEAQGRLVAERKVDGLKKEIAEQRQSTGRLQKQLGELQAASNPSEALKAAVGGLRQQLGEGQQREAKLEEKLAEEMGRRRKAEVQLELAKKTTAALQASMTKNSKAHQELIFSLQESFGEASKAKEEQGELVGTMRSELKEAQLRRDHLSSSCRMAEEQVARLSEELAQTSNSLVASQHRNQGLGTKLTQLQEQYRQREETKEASYRASKAQLEEKVAESAKELAAMKEKSMRQEEALRAAAASFLELERATRPEGESKGEHEAVEGSLHDFVRSMGMGATSSSPSSLGLHRVLRLLKRRLARRQAEVEEEMAKMSAAATESKAQAREMEEKIRTLEATLERFTEGEVARKEKEAEERLARLQGELQATQKHLKEEKDVSRKLEKTLVEEMSSFREENEGLVGQGKSKSEVIEELEQEVEDLKDIITQHEEHAADLQQQSLKMQQLLQLARLTILKEDEEMEKQMATEHQEVVQQKAELTEIFQVTQRLVRLKEEAEAKYVDVAAAYDRLYDVWHMEHEQLAALESQRAAWQEEAILSDALNVRISELEELLDEAKIRLEVQECVHEEQKTILLAAGQGLRSPVK